MAKSAERPSSKAHSIIAAAEAQIAASAISTILVAVAGAITLVSIAYAIYAALLGPLSPAGASAATGLVFAAVTGVLAVVGPKVIKPRASAAQTHNVAVHQKIDPATLRTGIEVGLAVFAAIADAAWQRRRKR